MNETPNCQQLRGELQEIRDLKAEFDVAMAESVRTGEVGEVKSLKGQLEERARMIKEKLWPFELLSKEDVTAQYEGLVSTLQKADILKSLRNGELGIVDISGQERPLPKLEVVFQKLGEQKETLTRKIEQGFAKLLLVPVGMRLGDLTTGYGKLLLEHKAQSKLLGTDGTPLELDTSEPVWAWNQYDQADVQGGLVYDVREFSANHQGKVKAALIAETEHTAFPGWKVVFVEELSDLVQGDQGETKGGRPPLSAGKSPSEYLEMLGKTEPYTHEEGLYPEDYVTLAMLTLEEKNQVIDDKTITYFTGAYFPTAGSVPRGCWRRGDQQADLSGSVPGRRGGRVGARSAVRVT